MSLLVASMSVGALLLSLGEPGPARAEDAAVVQRAAATAIGWVDADPDLKADAWRMIEVREERRPAGGTEKLLTAVAREQDDHFVINPNGALTICPAWHALRGRGTPDGAIQIRVDLQRRENGPTSAQRSVLNDLLDVLRVRCSIEAGAVVVAGPSDHDPATSP